MSLFEAGSRWTPIRPTWVEIDVGAFQRNLRKVAGVVPRRVKVMPVLKADGYGHGAVPLARAARALGERLWGFGVSSVEEGLALREAGVRERVLILGSLYPFESFETVLANDLIPTVASRGSAQALARIAQRRGRAAACHVKIDTGMGRIGMSPSTAKDALAGFFRNPWLRVEGVYTHLACAESASATSRQLRLFEEGVSGIDRRKLGVTFHASNSAGLLARPAARYDLVRPGLALYGSLPWPALGRVVSLEPVMSWNTRVVFVKSVSKGTPLSYGWAWRARRRSRIATLPVGYADGYRRSLTGHGVVLIKGRRCPVVGRVTMDQVLVDVTEAGGVDVGEEVVLMGRQGHEQITVEELGQGAGTVAYEIFCGVTRRVPRRALPCVP